MGEHLRLRGKIWYGALYVDAIRVERSTSCTEKEAARAVLRQWERDAADPDRASANVTLNDALNLLLDNRRARVPNGDGSAKTVAYYTEKSGHLVRCLGHDFQLASLRNASPVWTYIDRRRKEGAADTSIAKELVALRGALRLAKERGLWRGDIDAVIPKTFRPVYRPKTRSPTRPEVLRLLAQLRPAAAAVVAFIVATSAELGALQRAKPDDIPARLDSADLRVRVRGTKNEYRNRVVPIVTDEQRLLLAFAAKHAVRRDGSLFGPLHNFGRELELAATKAGLEHLSAHALRKACGQWLIDVGVPLELVSRVMGHGDTRITETVYARVKEEDMANRMIDAIDPRYASVARRARRKRKIVETITELPAPRVERTKFIVNGVARTLSEWARVSRISKTTLYNRVVLHNMSMADALALGSGGSGRLLPKSKRRPFETRRDCRTGAADLVDIGVLNGRSRRIRDRQTPQIQRENGYARSDSNGRHSASKADALSS